MSRGPQAKPDRRALVALDTCVVRHAIEGHKLAAKWPCLAQLTERFRFAIFVDSLYELARQVRDQPEFAQTWIECRDLLRSVIDPREPVVLRNEAPAWMGTRNESQVERELAHGIYRDVMAKPTAASLRRALLRRPFENILRGSYRSHVALAEAMTRDIRDGIFGDPSRLRQDLLDDETSTPVTFQLAAIRAINRAAPEPQDSPDTRILSVLDHPAYVLTHDTPLIKEAAKASSVAMARLMRLARFVRAATRNKLPRLFTRDKVMPVAIRRGKSGEPDEPAVIDTNTLGSRGRRD